MEDSGEREVGALTPREDRNKTSLTWYRRHLQYQKNFYASYSMGHWGVAFRNTSSATLTPSPTFEISVPTP